MSSTRSREHRSRLRQHAPQSLRPRRTTGCTREAGRTLPLRDACRGSQRTARRARRTPSLAKVLAAPWLEVIELREVDEVVAFARYKAELGGGPDKNTGEAAVLGWTAVHGGIAIIDERAGTRIAQRDGIDVHGTMWLVANGVRSERLPRFDAERIIDELAATDMALPVDGAGFFAWAYEEGLLP